MKQAITAAALVLLAMGCAPKQEVAEYSRIVRAVNLDVDVNEEMMTVSWQRSGEGMIGGYNIYISEAPLASKYPSAVVEPSFEPFNAEPFPGDTNPDDGVEYFVAEGLEDGVKYYVSVRVVFPDGSVSKPSNEVVAVCGPRGEIELSVRYNGEHDGFSFEKNEYVDADAVDNDLYFFSRESEETLNSPEKLNGFLRRNRLLVLPYRGSLDEVSSELANTPMTATENSVAVKVGDWVLIQTPEDKNALVNVLSFSGEPGRDREVRLFFAFSTLTGEAIF